MRKWLKSIRHSLPTVRNIILFIVVQLILQAMWYGVSKLLADQFLRDIGVIAVFIAGIFAAAWYLPKLSPILSGVSRKKERIYDNETERLGEVLISMINEDKAETCLIVEPKRVDFEHIRDKGGPYLVFQWLVYNMSVCNIRFEQAPTGHVLYKGQELRDTLEFLPGGLKPTLKRTESAHIELRQFLLPEVAEEILNTDKYIEFNFDLVQLQIDITWPPRVSGRIWNFPFKSKLTFKVPQDEKVAFL